MVMGGSVGLSSGGARGNSRPAYLLGCIRVGFAGGWLGEVAARAVLARRSMWEGAQLAFGGTRVVGGWVRETTVHTFGMFWGWADVSPVSDVTTGAAHRNGSPEWAAAKHYASHFHVIRHILGLEGEQGGAGAAHEASVEKGRAVGLQIFHEVAVSNGGVESVYNSAAGAGRWLHVGREF